ncbi:amidohydrolase family protein, partial [Escherichia coli]|uniref:amidohydrolase family protein n=2 Tax=Pseudomonadota TaxID=1224 RepID=UPI003B9F1C08
SNETTSLLSEKVWRNARLATLDPSLTGLGIIENGAIAVRNGRIVFVGPEAALPADLADIDKTIDCQGRWITPALIDCHTHLVFGGNRAMEF